MSDPAAGELEYLPRLPRDKSVGIGCIGTGFIMADCHLVAYRNVGFNPVAIAYAIVDARGARLEAGISAGHVSFAHVELYRQPASSR